MILADSESTAAMGRSLARLLRRGDVVALSGPLGVGKTTLARAILTSRGHRGDVPSPTFAIVQPYEAIDPPIWHVDLYRLEDSSEIAELGLDECRDGILIVEWPERAGDEAWPDALRLAFDFAPNGARCLTAQVPPSWQDRWPPR